MNKEPTWLGQRLIDQLKEAGQRLSMAHGNHGNAMIAEAEAKWLLQIAKRKALIDGVKGSNKEQRDAALDAAVAIELNEHHNKIQALTIARTQLEQAKIDLRIIERQIEILSLSESRLMQTFNSED